MNWIEIVFWSCFGIVFYSFLGYGILLGFLIKIKRALGTEKYSTDESYEPTVALIIPCFNEEGYIAEKIQNTLEIDYPKEKMDIIFISDGSNDNTSNIVEEHKHLGIIAMHRDERKGKAAAMNRAVANTEKEILIFCDANTALNKQVVKNIIKHFSNNNVGAVAGQKRIVEKASDSASGAGEGFYWKYESKLKKWDSELYTVVGAAGELMAYRASLYTELEPDTLLDDFMQSMRVAESGFRVIYEPDATATETASANVKEELKRKIRICAGGWQSMMRLKKARNPFHHFTLWFQYISHRVLRWSFAAFCLLALIPLNAILALDGNIFYQILFAGQALFYSLAIVGWILEQKEIRLKILYIPYYFFIMHYAVFAGLLRYFKGNQSALWERAKRG